MKAYLDLILAQREWSWTLVAMAYLAFTLIIRRFAFSKITRETKQIDPQVYSAARKIYQKNSLAGWAVFLISFLLVIAVWIGWKRPVDIGALVLFCLLLPLLFFLSLILHLVSYTRALLTILSQRMGIEREL